ncbi:MAG: class II aldolase/adducin family protein [Pseudolabrys sp.]|nr:class II aldolase/adducin family protein [Pseudolabrys sp.]
MATNLAEARIELALANRIVANEGVIDAFGHVSMRHPDNPNRYFLSRSRAPELVGPDDFIEYDLDSVPVRTPEHTQYSERVIHGEIYKARPEVNSVCHHHSPSFMPLLGTGADYIPIFHLGAVGGIAPPYWDQHDEFGDTNMLVIKPEEGASLARALGAHWMVLMRRHGVTVAGTSVKDCVFRSVYSSHNAGYQVRAMTLGSHVASLSPGETALAGNISGTTTGLTRSWEYWSMRVAKAGGAVSAAKATGKAAKFAQSKGAAAKKTSAAKKERTAAQTRNRRGKVVGKAVGKRKRR